jgi:hypothetical protein
MKVHINVVVDIPEDGNFLDLLVKQTEEYGCGFGDAGKQELLRRHFIDMGIIEVFENIRVMGAMITLGITHES